MIFLATLLILFLNTRALHLYAGAQQTYLVSQSTTLKNIYNCKDRCFKLNETFAYPMKYIRTVWAKPGTNHMYLQGHCFLQIPSISLDWISWAGLNDTNLVYTDETKQIWGSFNDQCENKIGEMTSQLRQTLGLTFVHSQYIFYSDGKFENTQENKNQDINALFQGLLTSL